MTSLCSREIHPRSCLRLDLQMRIVLSACVQPASSLREKVILVSLVTVKFQKSDLADVGSFLKTLLIRIHDVKINKEALGKLFYILTNLNEIGQFQST